MSKIKICWNLKTLYNKKTKIYFVNFCDFRKWTHCCRSGKILRSQFQNTCKNRTFAKKKIRNNFLFILDLQNEQNGFGLYKRKKFSLSSFLALKKIIPSPLAQAQTFEKIIFFHLMPTIKVFSGPAPS